MIARDRTIKDFLRPLPLLAGLSDGELDRLLARSEIITVAAGQVLIVEGDPADAFYVILEGELEITKRAGQTQLLLDTSSAGQILGEMALLEQRPRMATARATADCRLVKISRETFEDLIAASPAALREVLRTTAARVRNNEETLRQNEKLAALGAIAAGLAHELNNPAAALTRSAALMATAMTEWERLTVDLERARSGFSEEQRAALGRLRQQMEIVTPAAPLSPLDRSDREDELQKWLEDEGVDRAWDVAPLLVAAGWDMKTLLAPLSSFPPSQRTQVVQWLAAGYSVFSLLRELGMGAGRISELVKAVKSYTYLDQAPVQEVDIHQGLDDTLLILRHKIKAGVTLRKEYAAGLPRIEGYGSQLNQVWTNLIDNAVDALDGQGVITIRTSDDGECVNVEICDTGSGIPPDVQRHIFEPFFTTKPQGAGTGLGLHMVRNIVHAHHGQITVTSEPGDTCFRVTLPRTLAA